ncbi:hypothetical protein PM082_006045 [Marasmius tenuissimus]|nr:hypothetical protein PM082_006045 [Marasmius tenuissimus]
MTIPNFQASRFNIYLNLRLGYPTTPQHSFPFPHPDIFHNLHTYTWSSIALTHSFVVLFSLILAFTVSFYRALVSPCYGQYNLADIGVIPICRLLITLLPDISRLQYHTRRPRNY